MNPCVSCQEIGDKIMECHQLSNVSGMKFSLVKFLNLMKHFSEVRYESDYSITKYMPKVSMESLSAVRSFLWAKQIEVEKLM